MDQWQRIGEPARAPAAAMGQKYRFAFEVWAGTHGLHRPLETASTGLRCGGPVQLLEMPRQCQERRRMAGACCGKSTKLAQRLARVPTACGIDEILKRYLNRGKWTSGVLQLVWRLERAPVRTPAPRRSTSTRVSLSCWIRELLRFIHTYTHPHTHAHTHIDTLSAYLPTCQYAYMPACLSVPHLAAYLPARLSTYLPACPPVRGSTCLHAYSPTYLLILTADLARYFAKRANIYSIPA